MELLHLHEEITLKVARMHADRLLHHEDIERVIEDARWAGANGKPRVTGVFLHCLEVLWLDAYDRAAETTHVSCR